MENNKNAMMVLNDYQLTILDGEILKVFQEELDGLGAIPFDYIKMPSGGSLYFEIPGDNPERPDTKQNLRGVIVHHHPINTYWKDETISTGAMPDCQSNDGKCGIIRATGEVRECANCPYNEFKQDGSGKDCKNGHRLYILFEGVPMPIVLTLPPTSLRPFKDYLAKRLLLRNKRPSQVVTEITLCKKANKDGAPYAEAQFRKVGDLNEEQISQVAKMTDYIKNLINEMPLLIDEGLVERAPAEPKRPSIDVAFEEETPQPTRAQSQNQVPVQKPIQESDVLPVPDDADAPPVRSHAANGVPTAPPSAVSDDDFEDIM